MIDENLVLNTINFALQKVGLKPLEHVNDSTNGGEWHGPCIRCMRESGSGGDDRFRVNPSRPVEDVSGMRQEPVFTCRQCTRPDKPSACWSGDLVEFVRYTYGKSYREARTFLHLPPKQEIEHAMGYTGSTTGTPHLAPSKAWQNRAAAFIRESQAILYDSSEGLAALRYLKETRKLTDMIIRQAQLGYHYPNTFEEGKLWGVEPLVHLDAGIVIPSWWYTNIMGISIRIPKHYVDRHYIKTGKEIRYKTVTGGSPCLYSTQWIGDFTPGTPLTICEGQFDGLSLLQAEYPGLAVFATGSAQNNQDDLYPTLIKSMQFDPILLAFDNDDAGRAATRFWLQVFNTETKTCAYPMLFSEHDVNDKLIAEGTLYPWIHSELTRIQHMRGIRRFLPGIVKENSFITSHPEKAQITVIEPSWKSLDEGSEREIIAALHRDNGTSLTIDLQKDQYRIDPPLEVEPMQELEVVHQRTENVILVNTLEEVYKKIEDAAELDDEFIVLDLETTGLDPREGKIISIMMGTTEWVTIIDMRPAYEEGKKEAYGLALQELFHAFGPTVTWIGHNLKFDMNWLHTQFDIKLEKVYDTMLVERVLYAGLPERFGLLEAAERYNLAVSKQERNWFIDLDQRILEWMAPFPVEQLNYMAQDIKVPYTIWEMQHSKIAEQNLRDIVDLEHMTLPAISSMEVQGVAIDIDRWRGIIAAITEKQTELETLLQTTVGKAYLEYRETLPIALTKTGKPRKVKEITAINLGSHVQVKQAYEWLGIHLESTDKDALIEHKNEHESIPLLLEWKQCQKFLTSFGEKMLAMVASDGRIHASFEQLGTVTGRMSCHSPNLQQIPKNADEALDIRPCFVAAPGYKLATADLSNIELRILADQSGDANMLDMFAKGLDLHSTTARLMFGLSDDSDPATHLINGKPARFIAKTINFGLAYGLQAPGLARRVDVSEEQAAEFISKYFKMFPGVKMYLDRLASQALNRGYSMTVMGRRRNYQGTRAQRFGPFRGEIERAAKNHPIQGTNADILKISLAMLHERLPENCHLILTVHDEIVVECPEDSTEFVIQQMQYCMETACKQLLHTVTIPQQKVAISDHWTK